VLVEHGIIIDKARDSSEEICLNCELSGPGRENVGEKVSLRRGRFKGEEDVGLNVGVTGNWGGLLPWVLMGGYQWC